MVKDLDRSTSAPLAGSVTLRARKIIRPCLLCYSMENNMPATERARGKIERASERRILINESM